MKPTNKMWAKRLARINQMPPFRQRLSSQASPISKPRIFVDDSLAFKSPSVVESQFKATPQIFGGVGIGPHIPQLLEARIGFSSPSIHENIRRTSLEIPLSIAANLLPVFQEVTFSTQSCDFGFASPGWSTPNQVEISELKPSVLLSAEFSHLSRSTISRNQFSSLDDLRVFGMNYQSRIWREVSLLKDEPKHIKKQGKRPFTKSYTLPEREFSSGKSKPKGPSFWDLIYALLQPPLILDTVENLYLPYPLEPYQITGIQFLMNNENALLADEMGTGKTVQSVVAIRLLIQKAQAKQVLVVCPLAVLRQWDEHVNIWASDLFATVVRGNQQTRIADWATRAHVYITTYDTLRQDIDNGILSDKNLNKFDVVILDEAQYIKNPASGRAKAIKKLEAGRRWALTGTPVENSIEDVASIFEFLRPGYLTSFDLYPAKIREKIGPYFLRRRKEDVLKDLPPISREDRWLELDTDQRKIYEEVSHRVRTELTELGKNVRKIDIFRILPQLMQICNFAPNKAHSPKLGLLLEHIETIVENERKVIIFSQYIPEGIEKLEHALKPYGLAKIIGGQNDRDEQIRHFQENKDIPILVASLRAGGVGLNLQVASYVIHFDHWWNPAVMWQAEGRAHRKGQQLPVTVYSYWMADTIEEKIYQTLESKGLLFKNIVDGLSETEIDNLISVDEWLDMLGVKLEQKSFVEKPPSLDLMPSEIQKRLFEITPSEFEHVVKELLHYLGYPNPKVTGRPGDGGIDVISTRNTPDGIRRVIAQCKRYKGTVGVEVARELLGVVASDTSIEKAFLVTTGEITGECAAFCERSGSIASINGIQVANYVRQFGIRI